MINRWKGGERDKKTDGRYKLKDFPKLTKRKMLNDINCTATINVEISFVGGEEKPQRRRNKVRRTLIENAKNKFKANF